MNLTELGSRIADYVSIPVRDGDDRSTVLPSVTVTGSDWELIEGNRAVRATALIRVAVPLTSAYSTDHAQLQRYLFDVLRAVLGSSYALDRTIPLTSTDEPAALVATVNVAFLAEGGDTTT